nr:MAG TPA: hypothetical protein [Myoviridae sp. ctNPX13]
MLRHSLFHLFLITVFTNIYYKHELYFYFIQGERYETG